MNKNSYKKLFFTLSISFIVMYLVMFLNVDKSDHIYLSLTRLYMAILMVAPMAILMLLMMRSMYNNNRLNIVVHIVSTFAFIFALVLLRTQTPIGDEQYMRAMIPHHSSAILTSKHANIRNAEVKKLSLSIIESQEREINQMKNLLKELNQTRKNH